MSKRLAQPVAHSRASVTLVLFCSDLIFVTLFPSLNFQLRIRSARFHSLPLGPQPKLFLTSPRKVRAPLSRDGLQRRAGVERDELGPRTSSSRR